MTKFSPPGERINVAIIIEACAAAFDVSDLDIRSARKNAEAVRARAIAMLLAKEMTGLSLQEIGAHFGQRDGSSVSARIASLNAQLNEPGQYELARDIVLVRATLQSVACAHRLAQVADIDPVAAARRVRDQGLRGALCVSQLEILAMAKMILAYVENPLLTFDADADSKPELHLKDKAHVS